MRLRGLDDVTKENDNLHSSKALSQTLALKHHGFLKAGLYPPERPLVQVTKPRLLFIFVPEYNVEVLGIMLLFKNFVVCVITFHHSINHK